MPEWTVIRIVKETYYVQDAGTPQEAKDKAMDPALVFVVSEKAVRRREKRQRRK